MKQLPLLYPEVCSAMGTANTAEKTICQMGFSVDNDCNYFLFRICAASVTCVAVEVFSGKDGNPI